MNVVDNRSDAGDQDSQFSFGGRNSDLSQLLAKLNTPPVGSSSMAAAYRWPECYTNILCQDTRDSDSTAMIVDDEQLAREELAYLF